MSLDMRVGSRPDTRGEIWLRWPRFVEATGLLGCTTDVARAELVGLSERQLSRARTWRVGEHAVAKVLLALRRKGLKVTFEELFEVREVSTAEAGTDER